MGVDTVQYLVWAPVVDYGQVFTGRVDLRSCHCGFFCLVVARIADVEYFVEIGEIRAIILQGTMATWRMKNASL